MSNEEIRALAWEQQSALMQAQSALHCVFGEDAGGDLVADEDPIHGWFNLTYSKYLVLPRSIIQSAPAWWQRRFVRLNQLDDGVDHLKDLAASYSVSARNSSNRIISDPYRDYDRGRRQVDVRMADKPPVGLPVIMVASRFHKFDLPTKNEKPNSGSDCDLLPTQFQPTDA